MESPESPRHRTPLRVRLRKHTLTLHWLAGMAGLLATLFFASTGFMLNHADEWNLGETVETKRELRLDPAAARGWTDGDAAIGALLRAGIGVRGEPGPAETRDGRLVVVFKSAGLRQEIGVDPHDGAAVMTETSHGLAGKLMALHRGEDVGRGWHLLIDTVAVLLVVITLSGFILWIATPRWRKRGLLALTLSAAGIAAIYATLA